MQTAQRSELWPKLNEYNVACLVPRGELSAPENQSGLIPGESELVRTEDIPPGLRPRHTLDHLRPTLKSNDEGCLDVSWCIPNSDPRCASLNTHNHREVKESGFWGFFCLLLIPLILFPWNQVLISICHEVGMVQVVIDRKRKCSTISVIVWEVQMTCFILLPL